MRVAKLVALIGMGADHFAKVIQEIDKVLEILEKEEAADLKTKESCETARSENTRSAVLKARDIDDLSDSISRLESEIEEVAKQIEEKQEEVNKIEEERESAKRLREDEKALWTQSANDDKAAVQLLEQAQTTLEAFYKANAFVQKGKQPRYDNEFVVGAGEAPPPPPKTWEDPYAGKEAESEGIFTILTLLIEDVQADMKKAKEAETEAAEAYEKFDKESSSQITELEGAITTLEGDKSDKEQKVEDDTSSRSTSKDELEAIVKTIKDLQPGCDFQLVNFQTRSAKRAVEKDGLEEAKAVLKGATFKKE
jgi:chromosome segregation ATPase